MNEVVGLVDEDVIRLRTIKRPAPETIEAYRALPDTSGLVARALDFFGLSATIPGTELRPLRADSKVVGPAITVRNIPEREVPYKRWQDRAMTRLGERESYFVLEPGDVVVIDGVTVFPASCLGPNSTALASALGAAGIVVSGAVTGPSGIRNSLIPVWSRGVTTLTGHHRATTVEINGPIGISGVRVDPGDLVVADDSGISIVPAEYIDPVLQRAREIAAAGGRLRDLMSKQADREELRVELLAFMEQLARRPKG
ncbi:MAG: RraA family protein [Bacillota bacterium]|nr:MAG: RraA family protein [Bacillota bacterium]